MVYGHNVIGALSDLNEYFHRDVGKTLTVSMKSGRTLLYQITGGEEIRKDQLTADVKVPGMPLHEQIASQTATYGNPPSGRLALWSCGGRFDPTTGEYEYNEFVYARLENIS